MKLKIYEELQKEVLSCDKCDLGCNGLLDGKDPHVVGQGNLNADLMFIAEAPGEQETIYKRPLTPPGTSGKIYEKVLGYLNLKREDVYTTNVVLCRPPDNRDPEPYEIMKCKGYLERQISLVRPKIIITFGRFAAQNFINNFKITRDHGVIQRHEEYQVDIFPLYHPAYVGAYAPLAKRDEFKADLKKLKKMLEGINAKNTTSGLVINS